MANPDRPPLNSVLGELTLATHSASSGGGSSRGTHEEESSGVLVPPFDYMTGITTPLQTETSSSSFTRGESSTTTLFSSKKAISSASNRKYKLWHFHPSETSDVCLGIIGQGSLFCTLHNCTKKHRTNQFKVALPGEAYVAKTNDSAFVDPFVKTDSLKPEVWEKWRDMSCTFEEWTNLCQLVSDEKGVKFSSEDLEQKNFEETNALAFKTPRKRKVPDQTQETTLVPQFSQIGDKALVNSFEETHQALTFLDDKSSRLKDFVDLLNDRMLQEETNSLSYFQKNDLSLIKIQSSIGSKPMGLDLKFDSPNVWLSIGNVADEISNLSEMYKKEIDFLKNQMLRVPKIESKMRTALQPLETKLLELETFAVNSTRKLHANIIQIANQISNDRPIVANQNDDKLLKRIELLERDMKAVKSTTDHSAIKYAGLGFRSNKESDAWIEINQPNDDFGLLMDYNTVLEHVYSQLVGQKILTNLTSITKMKLTNTNQAVALTSFETRIPKFFGGESKTLCVVKEEESYFKTIKSWDEWNTPGDGYRDQLKRQLSVFDLGHSATIDSELEPLTLYHSLVCKSLSDSVAWAHKFIKFIDDTYREYSRANFGTKKAWHVATKLGIALMDYISKPRTVIHNSFRISNHMSMSKTLAYANLKSLDLMIEIEKLEFKNAPVITSELTKFLALNSNYEAIDILKKKVSDSKEDVTKAIKEALAATKAAGTVGNNLDNLKRDHQAVAKRVKTLESNRG